MTQTIVEVDYETARKFFETDPTEDGLVAEIYIRPQGYTGPAGLMPRSRGEFASPAELMTDWRASNSGKPIFLIDPELAHPANPVSRDPDNPNRFIVT